MAKIKRFVKNYIPKFAVACVSLAFFFWVILEIAKNNTAFAELLSTTVGKAVRIALGALTSLIPFSIAELMLMLIPLAITVLIVIALTMKWGKARFIRFTACIVASFLLLYPIYTVTLGFGYHRENIADKIEISAKAPTEQELYSTLVTVSAELDNVIDDVKYLTDTGSSYTNLTVNEISELICRSYERINEIYPELELDIFNQRAKPVILSKGMTYLEILGIYSFFTGESNVNVHYPQYTLPFAIAHEFAHARGIARENEANFIAFLVCINSDNPYIKYSGYLNMYEYLASALSKTNKDKLSVVYKMTDPRVLGEIRAYSNFYYDNQIKLLGDISDFFNDNYLKSQGTEGIVSYGLVVRLCVGYYEGTK